MSLAFSKTDQHWWNAYVGIPYKWHGDTIDGCSCWGLVRLVQREVFGRELPARTDTEELARVGKGDPNLYKAYGQKIPLEIALAGDVLHMRGVYGGRVVDLHAGVITKPGYVLHIEEGTNSIIENYMTNQRCAWRVIDAYRYV